MPFTPFHLGPASWIGLLLFKVFDFPTFLFASVIIDIEPFCVLAFGLDYPVHGFFHSFLGSSIFAVFTAIIMCFLKDKVGKIAAIFKLGQSSSFRKFFLASFLGVYSHVFLDSFLHKETEPFYPIEGNPFFGLLPSFSIYLFCGLSFLAGIFFYLVRLNHMRA